MPPSCCHNGTHTLSPGKKDWWAWSSCWRCMSRQHSPERWNYQSNVHQFDLFSARIDARHRSKKSEGWGTNLRSNTSREVIDARPRQKYLAALRSNSFALQIKVRRSVSIRDFIAFSRSTHKRRYLRREWGYEIGFGAWTALYIEQTLKCKELSDKSWSRKFKNSSPFF